MNEAAAAGQYLVDYLGADTTLMSYASGVWRKSVPRDEPYPVVKIDRLDADDIYPVGLNRIWSDMTFLVRGIVHWRGEGQPDYTDVRAIGDRLDALLHRLEDRTSTALTDSGLTEVHAFREEPFDDEELGAGDLYLSVGGIYRLRARAA